MLLAVIEESNRSRHHDRNADGAVELVRKSLDLLDFQRTFGSELVTRMQVQSTTYATRFVVQIRCVIM